MDADEYMHLLSWCCFLSAIASILLLIASPSNASWVSARRDARFHRDIPSQEYSGAGHGDRSACHPARHQGRPRAVSGQAFYVVRVRGHGVRIQVHGGVDGRVGFLRHQRIRQSVAEGWCGPPTGVILAVFLAPMFIVAMVAPDTLLEMIGKDPTLTGRTEIWAYVIQDIWMKPLLGWGYSFFGSYQSGRTRNFQCRALGRAHTRTMACSSSYKCRCC